MGAVFYIPDFMEIQNPRAFPNRPERWRDNPEDAGDFSRGKCCLPCYAPAYFCRGAALFSPQSRWEWETQKFPPRKKVGAVFYIPDYMETQAPWTFPNRPERWRDNPESAKDFSPGEGDSPVMHRRIFSEGWSCSSPQSRREWETQKLPPRKKVGVVFIKAEPIDKARGKKTKKGLGGASCTLPQPLRMRKLKCMLPPAFQATLSFPPVKTSCFIGVQLRKKFVVLPADEMVKIPNFYPQVSFLHCAGGGFLLC